MDPEVSQGTPTLRKGKGWRKEEEEGKWGERGGRQISSAGRERESQDGLGRHRAATGALGLVSWSPVA